jgi:hypothetical protein
MRVIVAGPRTWDDVDLHAITLDTIIGEAGFRDITFVHGGCPTGIDQLTQDYCEELAAWYDNQDIQLAAESHPADWDSCGLDCPKRPHRVPRRPGDVVHPGVLPDYCPNAGPRRNRLVAGLGGDMLVAFIGPCVNARCRRPKPHDSHGTAGMIAICRRIGINVKPVSAR